MPAAVVVSTPAAVPSMAVEACARMVDAAAKSCIAPGAQPAAAQPNWDAMATAIAQQSNAIAWGAIFLTVILFLAGIAWGQIVVVRAEKEAREIAEKAAREEAVKVAAQEVRDIAQVYFGKQNGTGAEGSDIGVSTRHNEMLASSGAGMTAGAAEETETETETETGA